MNKLFETLNDVNTQSHGSLHARVYKAGYCLLFALIISAFFITPIYAQRFMERLDRGVVAIRTSSSQVYIGWRMFGTDPSTISFNVYRGSTKANSTAITNSTNFVDNVTTNETYTIRPVIGGVEQAASESATVQAQAYQVLSLQRPAGGTTPSGEAYTYSPNDCSAGDLDGDGKYEIIVKWDPSNAKDNSQAGYTGNVYLDAYKLNGTRMWRIDLGKNIRAGAHYTQFMVYDLDSDGKAEVACKTADGTISGTGQLIGSSSADYRNSSGYILTGPEFLTVFNGQTGAVLATTNYVPARGTVSSWGDSYGNRVDRFLAGIAYLDGQRPSLVMTRGYYTRAVLAAWDWRNGQLTQRWVFDSNTSGNSAYAGQGAHSLTVGDVDSDGKDEIVFGAAVIDDNGTGKFSTGLGHGDALHMSDMNPNRAGKEIWMVHEGPGSYGDHGIELHDASTGSILVSPLTGDNGDIGRGLAMDIDPNYAGYELWASAGNLYSVTGTQISTTKPSSTNFGVWWDGDLLRELLNSTMVDKWDYTNKTTTRLFTIYQTYDISSNNSTKSTPNLTADLFGDWREEMVFRSTSNTELVIFTTTIPTTNRIYTLMHDPQYRLAVAWQNVGYNQPPHPGFFLGAGMSAAPTPNIQLTGNSGNQSSITIQENTTGFCSVDGTVDSNNAGFTGAGFANANNAVGGGVNWSVSAAASGTVTLTWRYANGTAADRPGRLLVNGTQVAASISFPTTSAWTTWTTVAANVTLNAGTNTIRLEGTTANGLGNIDHITATGTGLQAVTCGSGARLNTSVGAENEELQISESERWLEAYPNPSSRSFHIRAKGTFNYVIYDQLGRSVDTGSAIDETEAGTQLKAGSYTLKVKTSNATGHLRLIKQ